MSNYGSQLRDPRWQRKRLEIMERDKFSCRYCGDKEKTLNVHHVIYQRGKAPWEYEAGLLLTLCEDCHVRFDDEFSWALAALVASILMHNHAAMTIEIMEILTRFTEDNRWCSLDDLSYDDGYDLMRLVVHMLHVRGVTVSEQIRQTQEGGAKCTA